MVLIALKIRKARSNCFDADGNKYDLTGKPAFSLCRCGGSVTKPFCDGAHSRIGFQGAELAVKKADGTS